MSLSDESLIARVAQGDCQAFEILYDRHAAMVLGILVQTLGERNAAEELMQETFWQVWQRASLYSAKRGAFTNWLFQIARSLALVKSMEHQTRN